MNLEEKSKYINELLIDLRAEYVVFNLQEEGFPRSAIQVAFAGPMKRKWSTDIDRCETESFENGEETLTLHLNRTGFYDALPEALFHQMVDTRHTSADEMAKDSMKLKAEEKSARLFFRIFENEIFMQSVDVVSSENHSLNSLHTDILGSMIPGFWKIDETIPEIYINRLVKFLPAIHKISGDYELTALCLENILDEKVAVTLSDREPGETNNNSQKEMVPAGLLGSSKLGKNLVLGNEVSGFFGKIIVEIGPLKTLHAMEFFQDGTLKKMLECLYGYFFPVEFDVETKLVSPEEQNVFVLVSESEQSFGKTVLGYNITI